MAEVVLVVGAAGGVGAAAVKEFIGQGCDVIGTVLNTQEANSVRTDSPQIRDVFEMDLSNATSVASTLAGYLKTLPDDDRLCGVVVCAAISPYGPAETTSLDLLRRTLEINTVSCIAIYQTVMPYLRKTAGRIIFLSSMSGRLGLPLLTAYTASKFALEGAVEVMRCEAAKWNVKVILLEPGGIKTGMVSNLLASLDRDIAALDEAEDALYGELYRGFRATAKDSYDRGRLKPEAVAQLALRVFTTSRPRARYPIGADSKALCFLAWLLPRPWLEPLLRKAIRSAAKK